MLTSSDFGGILVKHFETPLRFEVGAYDDEGPPVPIPNTVVKLISAENTWRAAARENRKAPT